MILHFSKKQLSLFGPIVILLVTFGSRLTFLFGTQQTVGIYASTYRWGYQDMYNSPVIKYKDVQGQEVTFLGETDMPIYDEFNVPVIYKSNNPSNAYVYTFSGFWSMPIVYSFVPLIIYFSFILSYVSAKNGLTIKFPNNMLLRKKELC